MSGEQQQCILDQIAALQASREIQQQNNTLLETKVIASYLY